MRVEVVGKIVSLKGRLLAGKRESSQSVSENQVLANFRAALGGKDSFFQLQDFIAGFPGQRELHGAYAGQFIIVFRRLDLSANRGLYSILSETVQELLKKASSSDALFATLSVTAPAKEEATMAEPSLVVQLEAIGSTPEQAEVRWCSGLEHLQEALLSASHLLKLHVAKINL
jgi:hypothetical protein